MDLDFKLAILAISIVCIVGGYILTPDDNLPILEKIENTNHCIGGNEAQLSTRYYKDGSINHKVQLTGETC